MSIDMDDARYLFQRAREEAAKADSAEARRAPEVEVAAHRELAIRYKVRALAASCPDQVLHDAMENFDASGRTMPKNSTH